MVQGRKLLAGVGSSLTSLLHCEVGNHLLSEKSWEFQSVLSLTTLACIVYSVLLRFSLEKSYQTGVLLRLRNLILTSAKLHIVKFAKLPHLTYCQTVWYIFVLASNQKTKTNSRTSNKCDNKSTYDEISQRTKLQTLHTWRLQTIAIIMYKVKSGLAPPYIADLFVVINSRYDLRNSDFAIPRFRTVPNGKHSRSYLGPVIWSKLEKSIRSSKSLGILFFKKRINLDNFTILLDTDHSKRLFYI